MFDSHHGKGMKKLEGAKASKCEDEGVDFISNMPDAILVSILSRLPHTEEAIRSSILSKRWRYLWTAIPFINIYCYRQPKHRENFKKNKFKEFVYWVLVNKSADLDMFHLCCGNYYSMSTVGRWIHAAVTRNVKHLDLLFCPKKNNENVELPHCLVTCSFLEVLKLNLYHHHLSLPKVMGFQALRVLDLTYVHLLEEGDLIKSFLASCPLLEDLILIDCFMNQLDGLCISSPNLKMLRIENLKESLMCGSIKICCPKLVVLDLKGQMGSNFSFECLDSLNEAVIRPKLDENISAVLFPGISYVESLSIDFCFLSKCISAAHDPGLPNLKALVLTTTMDDFTMDNFNLVLKRYSKLESLNLIIEEFYEKYEWLDDDETMKIVSPDVGSLEFFKLNGEEPKLNIDWHDGILEMRFAWGGITDFFYWSL